MEPEEFYAARDGRTNDSAGTPHYQQARCRLIVDPRTAETLQGQVMAITAANLLSRWCRDVVIVMPNVQLHPELRTGGMVDAHDRIAAEMLSSDPFGKFEFDARETTDRITLAVGDEEGDWAIDADAWRAAVAPCRTRRLPVNGGNVPIGAILAACLGVAQVFRDACSMPNRPTEPWLVDAFSLRDDFNGPVGPSNLNPMDLGRVLLVGAGAVGSTLLYFLRMTHIGGHWSVVDHDDVKVLNLSRSLLLGFNDVGKNKAEACAPYLLGSRSTVIPIPTDLEQYLTDHPRSEASWDVAIPEANERGARWLLQSIAPPLMVHGTTGTDWDVNFGRHIPILEDCLACRYPNDGAVMRPVCAEGSVPTEAGAEVHAALPFASALAGALALAELLKFGVPGYPFNSNFLYLQLKGTAPYLTHYQLRPKPNCLCAGQRGISRRFNGGTLFAGLGAEVTATDRGTTRD